MISTFALVVAGCIVAFLVGGFLTNFFVNEFFNEVKQHRWRKQQNAQAERERRLRNSQAKRQENCWSVGAEVRHPPLHDLQNLEWTTLEIGLRKNEMSDLKRLVLTRKKRETVVLSVGETRIVVTVNDIRKSDVSLAIEAKQEVKILRGELPTAALVQEKQEALHGGWSNCQPAPYVGLSP
jgi:carbon storage regulator CsrA